MPGKSPIFTPSSILFRPQQEPPFRTGGSWWRRRVPPPGPNGLLHRPFIAIATRGGGMNISAESDDAKGLTKQAQRRRMAAKSGSRAGQDAASGSGSGPLSFAPGRLAGSAPLSVEMARSRSAWGRD